MTQDRSRASRALSLPLLADLREGLAHRLLDPLIDWRNSLRSEPKTLYLHIGAHKTGTTAIQSTLRTESRRLRWRGFYYDRAFYRLGKILASRSPLPADELDHLRQEVEARLRRRPEPNIIGSSEAFFGDLFRSYANTQAVAEDLRAILVGYDVRIVACIRRQDHFIQSVYHQYVKRGGTLAFEAFIRTHDIRAYRWDELLGQYAAAFGRTAVSVSCYEDLFREPSDVLARMFRPLGDSGFRCVSRPSMRNPSLSPKGIEIAIRCNDLLDTNEQRVLRRFLQSAFARRPGDRHELLTEELRRELLGFYAPSNRRCFEEFLSEARTRVTYLPEPLDSGYVLDSR